MKVIFFIVALLCLSNPVTGQNFTIDLKGIVKCPNAKVGDKATLFGVTYEAVDNNLLVLRRNEGADLTKVCTSLVTNMSQLFNGRNFNQPIGNWDVSKVTDMSYMFNGSTSFNQSIGNWDVSKVTNMSYMFNGASSFNQPIGNWDVSKVMNMFALFSASPFNQEIGEWNVSNVTNMSFMFNGTPFNQKIDKWDVSNISNMEAMFRYNSFNQPIGEWNVSKVTNMNRMFEENRQFNQPVNQWCVNNLKSEPIDFSKNSSLTSQNKPVWGTCPGLPATSSLSTPTDNSIGTAFKPPFNWNPSTNATKYQLQVFEGVEKLVIDTTISSTSFTPLKSLKSKTLHNWRVRGINESKRLTGDWSALWRFTTTSIPIPMLTSPLSGLINIQDNPVQLVWNPITNSSGYHLQVSGFETFTNLYLENNSLNNSLFTLPNFISGNPVKYYWRVRSKIDSGEFGDWSEIWSFARAKLTSDDDEDATLPKTLQLLPNYPNPFNPTTQIQYQIPTAGQVSLQLYATDGRWLQTLKQGYHSAGVYTYTLEASSLSSGRYFVVLQQGSERKSIQISLVK
jgi:surface protein